jgi:hypothetical protein
MLIIPGRQREEDCGLRLALSKSVSLSAKQKYKRAGRV